MANHNLIREVYDNYRTARLNVKYYSARLEALLWWNQVSDMVIAVAAPGSVISGFWFLKTANGLAVWQAVAAIAGLTGFVKPFFKFGQKIKFFEQTLSGYRALEYDLYDVILKIKEDDDYTGASKKMFSDAMKKRKILATNPPENSQNKKFISKLYEEVVKEIPTSSLYFPEVKTNGNK